MMRALSIHQTGEAKRLSLSLSLRFVGFPNFVANPVSFRGKEENERFQIWNVGEE